MTTPFSVRSTSGWNWTPYNFRDSSSTPYQRRKMLIKKFTLEITEDNNNKRTIRSKFALLIKWSFVLEHKRLCWERMTTYNDILSHHNEIFNPLTHKSDWHLISLYHITPESHTKVMRIKELITCKKSSWLLNKFSFSAPWEMFREQCGEYAYWC